VVPPSEDIDAHYGHPVLEGRVSRRRFLVGAGVGAAGAAGAAVIGAKLLPTRRIWDDVTGACGEPGRVPPPSGLAVTTGTLASTHVPGPVGYAVAIPPAVRRTRTPFAVMLPGRGGTAVEVMGSTSFPDFLMEGIGSGTPPFALAAVDGGESYWHRRPDGEDRMAMLLDGFLPMLADRYGAGQVALVGWSMGGYGALLAAEEHPDRFAAVAAASPAIFASYDDLLAGGGDAFDSAVDFARHDVIAGAARLRGVPVRVDCGTADPFYANDQTFVQALPAPPDGSWFRGCHDGDSWRTVAPAQIAFLGANLSATSL
jgi:pimeloyl-ACP methyl ester carboxylesterase